MEAAVAVKVTPSAHQVARRISVVFPTPHFDNNVVLGYKPGAYLVKNFIARECQDGRENYSGVLMGHHYSRASFNQKEAILYVEGVLPRHKETLVFRGYQGSKDDMRMAKPSRDTS